MSTDRARAEEGAGDVFRRLQAEGRPPAVIFVAPDVAEALRAHPSFERLRLAGGVEVRTHAFLAPGTVTFEAPPGPVTAEHGEGLAR